MGAYSNKMAERSNKHKTMPNGMCKWYDAITLEEYNSKDVHETTKT